MKTRSNLWVVLGALAFAGILLILTFAFLFLMRAPTASAAEPTVSLTLIPAFTPTPPGMNSMFFTPTPTLRDPLVGTVGGIGVGVYVQITGTDGEGLRLRDAPGTGSKVRFLALDAEVFKVTKGPELADGYTWWYLEAPYDQTRAGWAAANFLTIVELQP